jgi:hypothetical protein
MTQENDSEKEGSQEGVKDSNPEDQWFDWDTESKPPETAQAQTQAYIQTQEPTPALEPRPEPTAQPEVTDYAAAAETPPAVSASAERPFSVWIEGNFTSEDRQKIEELISNENFGIRVGDLELQWEEGTVLLPQISEYAAMRVAQVLRESSLQLRLIPSEFKVLDSPEAPIKSSGHSMAVSSEHPAENIPVTTQEGLGHDPSTENWEAIDTILATGILKEPEWKATETDGYGRLVESLKRELRYRAHIKKAEALLRFQSQILPSSWRSDGECRVQVSALAVKRSTPRADE